MVIRIQPKFACQTYSWQMSFDKYQGAVDHMAATVAAAGFSGFEAETIMLNDDWTAPELLRILQENRLQLSALCLVDRWLSPEESVEEIAHADRVIRAVKQFPGAVVNLVQYPGSDRANLRTRQSNALSCMRDIARRAADEGVGCSFHPNSPQGSVFRTEMDYDLLMNELDSMIGYTPDSGHIAAGGMDPLAVIRMYRDRVKYVHIKDRHVSDGWAETGKGDVDIPGIVDYLVESGYPGWVTFEDESALAESTPDAAVMGAGKYVADVLMNRSRGAEEVAR